MTTNKNIYLWTGTGWGKTTSALGVAMRAIGHNKKVVVIQFMKGRKWIGEYKIQKKLGKYYKVYQFGRESFVDLKKPLEIDKKLAEKGLEFAKNILKKENNIFLLILDEINLAAAIGLLDKREVLEFIERVPKTTTIYMTGRFAPKEFIKRADYVTKVIPVKHPKIDPRKAKEGIDY